MHRPRFCSECGTAMPKAARTCGSCGQSAPSACPECGQICAPQARFCGFCGAAILAAGMATGGLSFLLHPSERKLVTILFVDMIDSLMTIRDSDPEEAHELLSKALGVMTAAVHSCGGTVARTLGDGLMVLFGAPTAREDHAVAACHAALRIIEAVQQMSADIQPLNVRIGLHSGLVVVGQSANDLNSEYDATGVAVHIASRLQHAAQPGRALLTAATQKLVDRDMLTRSRGFVAIKGLDEPIELFELCGARERPSAGSSKDSVFVGRASELVDLGGALRSVLLGKGRFIGIAGEAGIGKSKLIETFLELHADSASIFRTALERYSGTVPFHPVRDLLTAILGLANLSGPEKHPALLRRLQELGLDSLGLEVPLADLLETVAPPPDWLSLNPEVRNHMTISAVRSLLLRESERRPLILVIEDVQRADSATINLIGNLADAIVLHRILLLVSFRQDFEAPWNGKPTYRTLRLERLDAAETDELIDRLVAKSASRTLRNLLLTRSQGNPLFLNESIHALMESGALTGEIGALEVMREPGKLDTPDSVSALIAERVDHLPPDLKTLLQIASVLGEQFRSDILGALNAMPPESLQAALEALETQEFIRAVTHPPTPIYAFRHALFQEVCYASLLKRRRRELHARVFSALAGSKGDGDAPPVEQLAHHAFRGGLWEKAVEYCRSAGRRALYLSANREAVRHFENAALALSRADPDGLRLAESIDLQLELRAAHVPLLHMEKVGEILHTVRDAASRLGDRARLAQITGFMAGHAYLTQSPRKSMDLCLEAIRLSQELNDPSLEVAPNIYLGQAFHALGRFRKSIAALERNFIILPNVDRKISLGLPSLPRIMTARWIALSLAELGAFDAAEDYVKQGDVGVDHPRPFDQVYSQSALGFVLLVRGEFERAREVTAEALALADKRDLPFMIPVVASQLGLLLAYLGEQQEALLLTRRAVRTAEDIGILAGRSRWYARLAEACLLAGDYAEAMQYTELALQIAHDLHELGYACYALRLRGLIAQRTSRGIDAARADITEACMRARRLGMAPLVAKCSLDLAVLERQAGRPALAHQHFSQALRGFRRLKMASWSERAMRSADELLAMAEP